MPSFEVGGSAEISKHEDNVMHMLSCSWNVRNTTNENECVNKRVCRDEDREERGQRALKEERLDMEKGRQEEKRRR